MARLSLAEHLALIRKNETLADIVQRSTWDRYVVMQVVLLHGAAHDTFSANDIRDLLPDMGKGFLGAAINGLRTADIIARIPADGVPSTLDTTHGHRLTVWRLTGRGHRIAAQRFHQTEVAA